MKRQLNRVTSVAVPLALATLVMSPVAAQQKPAKATPSASAGQQGGAQKATDAKPQPPPTKADLKDVVRHPDNYLGKTIEVEGEVLDVMPPHMMVIDARRWFHPWGGVLVVTPVPVVVSCGAPPLSAVTRHVVVTGVLSAVQFAGPVLQLSP